MAEVKTLLNIGVVFSKKLDKIGIKTAEQFLKKDPYKVFEQLQKKVDPSLCRCALACVVGAHFGLPWHKITKKSATEYEKRHPGFRWGKC